MKLLLSLAAFLIVLNVALTKSCNISSHIISVDTNSAKKNHFDLLVSLSSTKNCISTCKLSSGTKARQEKTFYFAFRYYTFLRFQDLKQYHVHKYKCFNRSGEVLKHKNTGVKTYSIHFPKNRKTTRLIAFGDWGMSLEGDLSLNHMAKVSHKIDAILFLGDIAYNLDFYQGRKGNDFMEYMRPVSHKTPFMLSVGNHEKANNFEQYKKRFFMPNHQRTKNLYYSYDINNIHIVSMNSEIFFNRRAFSREYKHRVLRWLKDDLKKTNKEWKIVYMHRPFYCSLESRKKRCTKQAKRMSKYLEPLVYKYRVDLFLTGHNHYYERTLPVYKMKVDRRSLSENDSIYTNPRYTTYVTCGISGTDAFMPKETYKPRYFSKKVSITVGLCYLKINSNTLDFKFVNSRDSSVMDSFRIIKDNK